MALPFNCFNGFHFLKGFGASFLVSEPFFWKLPAAENPMITPLP